MKFARLLNLVQAFISWQVDNPRTEQTRIKHQELIDALTGVPISRQSTVVIDGHEVRPPSWWISDKEAMNSTLAAMRQM